MLKKIKLFFKSKFKKVKYYLSHESCYRDMERLGIADFGRCDGIYGGDKNTEYLSYQCIECPYINHGGR